MRVWNILVIIVFLGGLCTSCSGKISPITPHIPYRFGADFDEPWGLWDPGVPSIQYKNVDTSVLVYAGPDADGTLDYPAEVDGKHWTIVSTIEHVESEPQSSRIK